MKNHLGIKVIALISLCLFAWSGYVCAAPPAEGKYTVFSATGGHMEKHDVFEISSVSEDGKKFKITPKDNPNIPNDPESLKKRWNGTEISLDSGYGEGLCGFIDFDTDEHKGNKYGHDKTHGILVRAMEPEDGKARVEIIWSAIPLQNKDKKLCKELEKRFHGGMAHASQ
ncbi:MAG: hypothetical protein KJN69_14220 [Gammaproteobacteria bacterium]|nr:hypothetical protein [Gammaproteobacteria bacterium]